jgi:hypothetical protein
MSLLNIGHINLKSVSLRTFRWLSQISSHVTVLDCSKLVPLTPLLTH